MVPKLHRVDYAVRRWKVGQTGKFYDQHELESKDHKAYNWCMKNCHSPFYMSPSWTDTKFVEFEDDQEALMFALTMGI